MKRFVIGPDIAVALARREADVATGHRLLAPTLLRSQVLSHLYAAVRRGDLDRKAAERQLDYLRALRIRLLGDRVLQKAAWRVAAHFDWPDTHFAEYVALTQLQADALVTLDAKRGEQARELVALASLDDLFRCGN